MNREQLQNVIADINRYSEPINSIDDVMRHDEVLADEVCGLGLSDYLSLEQYITTELK